MSGEAPPRVDGQPWPVCPGHDGDCGEDATMPPESDGRILCRDCWMVALFSRSRLAGDEELARRFGPPPDPQRG